MFEDSLLQSDYGHDFFVHILWSLLRIASWFGSVFQFFYGLLEQITSSNEPYNSIPMSEGSNEVNIVAF